MRYAKLEDGTRRFALEKFLSPQQFKWYFSGTAGENTTKSSEDADECDSQATEEEDVACSSTRAQVN